MIANATRGDFRRVTAALFILIGHAEVLPSLYTEVLIPEAVGQRIATACHT